MEDARGYRERILAALPSGAAFEPLMTLYLTDNTSPDEIAKAKSAGFVKAVKYYPAGATTNSDSGVTDIRRCDAVLEAMAAHGIPLLMHGEVTDPEVDVFDREKAFIETVLVPLVRRFPKLRVVLEHVTTSEAALFVSSAPENIAATITAHHLLMNRNALFAGGLRPHHYCLPVLKREPHRLALVKAAVSGQSPVLPRHGHGAACARGEGIVLRERGNLHGARRDGALLRGVRARRRARQARGIREPLRCRISTACRGTRRR